mgnify:CR=1 FL=1
MKSTILTGDALEQLKTIPDGIVNTCVTSPPYYGLRDYGVDGQIGLEETPEQYINKLVAVFSEVKRVLRDDGTLWVNIGDSYAREGGTGKKDRHWDGREKDVGKEMNGFRLLAHEIGLKQKDLIGIPWMLAFALRADGWYLRQDIIWAKPNPMPESVKDRCTKSHEYIFLLSKAQRYYYDAEAIREDSSGEWNSSKGFSKDGQSVRNIEGRIGARDDKEQSGRNKRSVWTVTTKPFKGSHFAVFPPDLIEPCILAGSPFDGLVLDPFTGSGTTAVTALQNGRNFIGVELNPKYVTMAQKRIKRDGHYQERMLTHG